MNDDEISGYYDDDGEKLIPNLISRPFLCITCRKDEDEECYYHSCNGRCNYGQ